ncbi:Choline dehydrogenase [Termitomyces sp. T112]|nr:Choline dehydrogenase [Termitomyces sp. T112]
MFSSDYVIIGAGLSGTVLATRLSEDPAIVVTVLEAGTTSFHDDNTDIPGKFFDNIGAPGKDWSFFSIPQKGLGDRPVFLPRGKNIGGSSLLNFMEYNRASSVEYDSFEKLGSDGWNWKSLVPYFRKANEQAATYGFQFDKDYYGTSGPLQRCVPRYLDQVALPWIESIKSLGVKANPDPNAGDNTGVWITTATLDRNSVRSSAASAYYEPNQSRPNLKIICGAQATRIILSGKDTLVANGVEYLVDGVLHTINATKEVILSAGTYKTPQILELSGIGDPEVLKSFGIEVAVNLPGVGNNLQVDHVTATFTAQLKPGHETFARLADAEFERMQKDLFKATGRGMLAGVPAAFAFLSFKDLDKDGSIANLVADLSLPTTPVSDVHKQWVCDNTVSFLE